MVNTRGVPEQARCWYEIKNVDGGYTVVIFNKEGDPIASIDGFTNRKSAKEAGDKYFLSGTSTFQGSHGK